MPGSISIGRIAGIRIQVNYSWLIIFVLVTVSLALGWFPILYPVFSPTTNWILAIISALLLFAAVLAHELAHSLVAQARGLPIKSITLFVFGGVSNIEREPRSAGDEFIITVVGPLTSLVIGGICWLIGVAVAGANLYVAAVLGYLAIINVLLGLFNLIPGFPLDGGRILRAAIWGATGDLRRATYWASRVGQVVAFLFILWGIWQIFTGNLLGGIWIGFIGWFLLTASQSENTQMAVQGLLRGVTVADAMVPVRVIISPETTLRELAEEFFLRHGQRAAAVVQEGRLVGLITLTDLREVPRERWPETTAGQVMVPLARLHVVAPHQSLADVLPLIAGHNINQLPVLEDGRLVGMVSRDAIVNLLEVRRTLKPVA